MAKPARQHVETDLIHEGRPAPIPGMGLTTVNQPVYHCSSLLYGTCDERDAWNRAFEQTGKIGYGIGGTDLTHAFEDLLAKLEGGAGAIAVSSGLAAVTAPLLALTKAGDHVLIPDNAYSPTRRFCDEVLQRFGVSVSYYDPEVGAGIDALMRPNTAVIFLESPGSVTFELQDLSAITAVAQRRGARTIIDNTWATPLFLKPLSFGVDVSVHATTKYIGGHSDLMGGVVICNAETLVPMRKQIAYHGHHAAPDDLFLAMRGLRSLDARLERHQRNGLAVAQWLEDQPLVARVLHPGLPSFPRHDLFQRYFTGATSLFAFQFSEAVSEAEARAFIERLDYFGLGASWGGFESLVLFYNLPRMRTATTWPPAARPGEPGLAGPLLRLHIGLENPADLIADLASAMAQIQL